MSANVHFSAQKTKTKKKVNTSAYVYFSAPKQVKTEKKGHHVPRPKFALKLSKIFRGRIILHVFTVHNAKKEDVWPFLGVLGGQIFFGQKGGHILQKEDVW